LVDEAFGYLKRVIVTPAVYPRFREVLRLDIQSTGQKSHTRDNVCHPIQNARFQLNSWIPLHGVSSIIPAYKATQEPVEASDFAL